MPDSFLAERAESCPLQRAETESHHERKTWNRETRCADDAFRRGDHSAATDGHQRALHIASQLLSAEGQADGSADAPALLVASYHNLAQVALAQGLSSVALKHFRAAFELMLRLAQATATPSAVRQSCATQLQPSLSALAMHMLGCGAPLHALQRDIRHARRVRCNSKL